MSDQIYATIAELIADMGLPGDEPGLLDRIRQASSYIEKRLGNFIPLTESRKVDESDTHDLSVEPLLSVTSLTVDTDLMSSSAYTFYPRGAHWESGPYTRIYMEDYIFDEESTIVGTWGLYSASELLGINATQATSTETSLVVTNGSLLSPGMTVLIESEQELVTAVGATTAATSLLNGAIDAATEEITVDNGAEFLKGEVLQLGTEDVHVRSIGGHVLVCDRGWNGTTKASHANDLAIAVYRTFTVKRGANGTTAATHSSKAISRCMVPYDVNWIVRQVAGLMRMKAKANFASKTGNAELGESFYYNEFPQQIKNIQANYRIVRI
jgi:hypothetical protein